MKKSVLTTATIASSTVIIIPAILLNRRRVVKARQKLKGPLLEGHQNNLNSSISEYKLTEKEMREMCIEDLTNLMNSIDPHTTDIADDLVARKVISIYQQNGHLFNLYDLDSKLSKFITNCLEGAYSIKY